MLPDLQIVLAVLLVATIVSAAVLLALMRESHRARIHRIETALLDQAALLQSLAVRSGSLEAQMEEIRIDSRSLAGPPQIPTDSQVSANVLSLQKRSRALKLIRKNEPPERIAATLHVPLNQVRMLVKIQALLAPTQMSRPPH